MTISYQHNNITHNGTTYSLDEIRAWVVDNHPDVLTGHHVKTKVKTRVNKENELSLAYDWRAILNEGLLRLYVLSKI